MSKYIIPVPYAYAPYGITEGDAYTQILQVSGSSQNYADNFPNNLLIQNCQILDPVTFEKYPDDQPEIGHYLKIAESMQENLASKITDHWSLAENFLVIGGDHTIAIGTGLGLSQNVDMSEVGLIWVDAHGDANNPKTSLSKSITGYPLAINKGDGPKKLTQKFQGNFLKKVVQIGLRDVDEVELKQVQKHVDLVFSVLEVEQLGIVQVLAKALEFLNDCKYIWLSIDVDSLDAVYFEKGETDLPVTGGLTPRELLYITKTIQATNKLKITEITQLNNVYQTTNLTVLFSRISELSLGLGGFRYGHS